MTKHQQKWVAQIGTDRRQPVYDTSSVLPRVYPRHVHEVFHRPQLYDAHQGSTYTFVCYTILLLPLLMTNAHWLARQSSFLNAANSNKRHTIDISLSWTKDSIVEEQVHIIGQKGTWTGTRLLAVNVSVWRCALSSQRSSLHCHWTRSLGPHLRLC